MQIACPQCGASIAALTETRFYRCAFCGSAFIVQETLGVEQYTISHLRDDRVAWSALADHLERRQVDPVFEKGSVEFRVVPFWSFALHNGASRLISALAPSLPELSGFTLPSGDLRFPDPGEEFASPEVTLADAERSLGTVGITGRSLVHLPLYVLTYAVRGTPFLAVVSGVDRKVYALTLPAGRELTIPRHHLVMVACYAVLLVIEGLLIRPLPWRAAAFAVTGLMAGAVMFLQLRREC